MMCNERNLFIQNSNGVVDIVDSGLIDFLTCLFCQYMEPLGLHIPLMAV